MTRYDKKISNKKFIAAPVLNVLAGCNWKHGFFAL